MTPDEALAETKQLLPPAIGSSSTREKRRNFFQHLILLCGYPSYECKSFFGTLVAKFFAEFEDLQDSAVDAILDLCEDDDEKTRIIGIKGLGATGKAEPKWVRGNTGVLLQLLECPLKELEHVRQSLQILLSIGPSDVFAVMADDCKGSEEETAASRRNILEYLSNQAVDTRKMLESGENLEAEKSFREGFYKVLNATSFTEGRIVLDMLLPLSTISGKNATRETTSTFCKALIKSLPAGSTSTDQLVSIFTAFIKKSPPLDPRYDLLFLSVHGGAVFTLGVSQKEEAVGLISKLRSWANQDLFIGKTDDREISENSLASNLTTTMLSAVLSHCKKNIPPNSLLIVETVLYGIYGLLTKGDRRRDISKKNAGALEDLGKDADEAGHKLDRSTPAGKAWRNVRDMAEILSDYKEKVVKITPSWEIRIPPPKPGAVEKVNRVQNQQDAPKIVPAASTASTSKVAVPMATAPIVSTAPSIPIKQSQRIPSGPKAEQVEPLPVTKAPVRTAPVRTLADSTVSSGPKADHRGLPPHLQASSSKIPLPPLSTAKVEPVIESPLATAKFEPVISTSAGSSKGVIIPSPLPPSRPSSLSTPTVNGTPATPALINSVPLTNPAKTPSVGLNIRSTPPIPANGNEHATKIIPIANSAALQPSHPNSTSPPAISQPSPAVKPIPTTIPSLAERLGMAPAGTAMKRPLDDEDEKPSPRPSLLDRLGSKDGTPNAKRIKETQLSTTPEPSLLSRMSRPGLNISTSSSTPKPQPPNPGPTRPNLSILNRGTPTPSSIIAPPSLSIRTLSQSKPTFPSTSALPTPPPELTIRNRSSSSSHAPPVDYPDEGIVRKGRGFQKVEMEMEDIIVTAPPKVFQDQFAGRGGFAMRGMMARGGFERYGR